MGVSPLALARGRLGGPPGRRNGGASCERRLHAPAAEWEVATLDRILIACAEQS